MENERIMSKSRKSIRKAKPPRQPSRLRQWWTNMDPQRRRGGFIIAGWAILGILAVVGVVSGMQALQKRVIAKRYAGGKGAAVVRVTSVPSWMPASLAQDITDTITPPDASLADTELAAKVYRLAQDNPMIREATRVEVCPNPNGPGGVVEVDLEFRRPFARVQTDAGNIHYVDSEGACLPVTQVPMYVLSLQNPETGHVRQICYQALGEITEPSWRASARRIHYVTIDRVLTTPPRPGRKWSVDDLDAGLRLVKLVSIRPYYSQITVVDVSNHACRITRNDPELRMYAQIGRGSPTDIRFGRFPEPGSDIVVSPQRKIWYLDDYTTTHGGRLAGLNTYLDLRYDNLHVSVN
jgi:hypothetical protein